MSVRRVLVVLALALAPRAVAQDRVRELVAESRFAAALDEVAREPDPLRRAQNAVWVRHVAGDLHGALDAGLAELKAHAKDPFLLEQSAFIALSLRKSELAAELVGRLATTTTSGELSADDVARYSPRVALLEEDLRAQTATVDARRRALHLARGVVLGALGAVALLTVFLAWSTARPRA